MYTVMGFAEVTCQQCKLVHVDSGTKQGPGFHFRQASERPDYTVQTRGPPVKWVLTREVWTMCYLVHFL